MRNTVSAGFVLAIGAFLAACSGPASPATTPTVVAPPPTPTFRPAVPPTAPPPTSVPTVDPRQPTATADAGDVEAAFLSNIDDLIADATDLAVTPCDDLVSLTRENPGLVSSIHGFAATLKRVSTNEAVLNTDNVKAGVADLDQAMGKLDAALSACGISSSATPQPQVSPSARP